MEGKSTRLFAAALAVAATWALANSAAAQTEVDLPEGTRVVFTLDQGLSTKYSHQGDKFSGVVSRPVGAVNNQVIIPKGSLVRGTVSQVKRAGRIKGRARLGLLFEEIELPDGRRLSLSASLAWLDTTGEETVTEEGQVKGEGSVKRDLMEAGIGSGMGSWIGAIASGAKGLAIGAGAGAAAAGAIALLRRGEDIEIPAGTTMGISLNRPLAVRMETQ